MYAGHLPYPTPYPAVAPTSSSLIRAAGGLPEGSANTGPSQPTGDRNKKVGHRNSDTIKNVPPLNKLNISKFFRYIFMSQNRYHT